MKTNPLTKIISLSILLATGFLFTVLSCALFDNWLPLFDILIFLIAPIPNALASSFKAQYEADFMSDSPQTNSVVEFAEYMTGFLVVGGLALPLVFFHVLWIPLWSFVLCEIGGLIIYSSIVLFGWFFREDTSDDYDF